VKGLAATVFVTVAALAGAVTVTARGASGFFVSTCTFSHRATDDPIVFPALPGVSHDHTFVGNVSTNAFSTLSSLKKANTSCVPRADTAAYWAPTLFADGRPVTPITATIYYRRLTLAPVRPFPPGLRMVAGDSHAVAPQSMAVTYWDCSLLKTQFYGPNDAVRTALAPAASSSIPSCPPRAELQLHVNFPECWDGRHLDSPDHRGHMAYAVSGRCPASHPVGLPALELVYSYPARATDGAGTVNLSSGGQTTGHADFINAWNQPALAQRVHRCLNEYAYCTAEVNLG
jgi:uncharacterized protein DUF1996